MNDDLLIARAVAALEPLGFKIMMLKQPRGAQRLRADAWLRITRDGEQIDYVVEAKRAVTPATMGAIVAQLRNTAHAANRPVLLAADYLTPPVAEKLREQQQQFVDAAGNAYLVGPGLFVYVVGRKLQDKRAAPRAGRAFTTNGLKLLFALIGDPELADKPQRAIAAAAGVALGAVPAILEDLQRAGHLLVADQHRRLNATKRLLDEWAFVYAHKLRAKTLQATYVTQNFEKWRHWQLDPKQVLWGGEPAANLLVGHLRPGILTLYTDRLPPRLIVEQRMMTAGPMATDHLVEIRKQFWGQTLRANDRTATVPPALVYADLLATGDGRCIETAQIVYDGYLARLLPAA